MAFTQETLEREHHPALSPGQALRPLNCLRKCLRVPSQAPLQNGGCSESQEHSVWGCPSGKEGNTPTKPVAARERIFWLAVRTFSPPQSLGISGAPVLDFPGGSDGKASCLQCGRPGFNPWVWKISWRKKWQPTPVFLPENPMDGGAWGATIHGVAKSQTRLSFWFLRE